jgi:hypothetical protein
MTKAEQARVMAWRLRIRVGISVSHAQRSTAGNDGLMPSEKRAWQTGRAHLTGRRGRPHARW